MILVDGDKVSQTFGRDAIYYWLERDNSVKRSPFEVAGEPEPPPPTGIQWDPYLYMRPQVYSWDCAACAQDWVLRSTGAAGDDHNAWQNVQEIGYPENINGQYGLMDGSGSQLRRVYSDYGSGHGAGLAELR